MAAAKNFKPEPLPIIPDQEAFSHIVEVASLSPEQASDFRRQLLKRLNHMRSYLAFRAVDRGEFRKKEETLSKAFRDLADELGSMKRTSARRLESVLSSYHWEIVKLGPAALGGKLPPDSAGVCDVSAAELVKAFDTFATRLDGHLLFEQFLRRFKSGEDAFASRSTSKNSGGSPGRPGRRMLCDWLIRYYHNRLGRRGTGTTGGELQKFVEAVFIAVGWDDGSEGRGTDTLVQRALARYRQPPHPMRPKCSPIGLTLQIDPSELGL